MTAATVKARAAYRRKVHLETSKPKGAASVGPERKPADTRTFKGRFGKRLRRLRDNAGLSSDELATAVGVSQPTIYHWETGHAFPNAELLPLLAKKLGCQSVGELFPDR